MTFHGGCGVNSDGPNSSSPVSFSLDRVVKFNAVLYSTNIMSPGRKRYYEANKPMLAQISQRYRSTPESKEKRKQNERENRRIQRLYDEECRRALTTQHGHVHAYSHSHARLRTHNRGISHRDHMYWYKYGMTIEDYEGMLNRQHGRCAICGTENPGQYRFVIDHCHRTGRIRGILCNTRALQQAIKYLLHYSK